MLEFNLTKLVFYSSATLAVLGASLVIISKNPVKAVLSLVFTFFCTAVLWLLLESDFLAMTLVLVYVGAVMVLFLFVVMTLNIDIAEIRAGFSKFLPLSSCIAVLVLMTLIGALGFGEFDLIAYPIPPESSSTLAQVKVLGEHLYSDYLFPFELAGILLLVAIITAISLTFRSERTSKMQVVSQQTAANKANRLKIVSMKNDGWVDKS